MDRQRAVSPALARFAERLRYQLKAQRVLLFGSYARGDTHRDSDYDLLIVSPIFEGVDRLQRHFGLRDIWYEVGGYAPMDLICLTPREFDFASTHITLVNAVLPEAIDLLPVEAPVG